MTIKNIFRSFLTLLVTNTSFGQDYIIKKDWTKLEVKVLEISSTEVKYTNFNQPNGPFRILGTHEITEIIYENGEFEKFEVNVPLPQNSESEFEQPKKREKKYSKLDMMGAGFAIDILYGYSQFNRKVFDNFPVQVQSNERSNATGLSLRMSNKWYFDVKPNWRTGIQVSYFRIGGRLKSNDNFSDVNFLISPFNIGSANIIKFKENIGLEVNLIAGPTFSTAGLFEDTYVGIGFNPDVKIRFGVLAIGFDYMYATQMQNEIYHKLHQLSFTIGAKF